MNLQFRAFLSSLYTSISTYFSFLDRAIDIAYNIPGLESLNLNSEAVVGIFNGTIRKWNHPIIVKMNPGSIIPEKEIVVVVRGDTSGTTRAFTSGLSSFSSEWKHKYGVFSEGRDKNTRMSSKWDNDTVKYFGQTNHGITELVISIDYSVAYVSAAHAQTSNVKFAALVNRGGNLVNATVETVRNAILSANGSSDIMNTPGEFAYPLSSFTYFIVPLSTSTDCDAVVELVRYVNWFYFTESAKQQAMSLYMVPLDQAFANDVVNNVLKVMTCRGNNVWNMMLKVIEAENDKAVNRNWLIPTFVTLCITIALCTGLVVHFGRQQILLHRELLKDTWKIDHNCISLDAEAVKTVKMHEFDVSIEDKNGVLERCGVIGVFGGKLVTLFRMARQKPDFSLSEKKSLLWMRDTIRHANVMEFMGLTKRNGSWSILHREMFLGSLSDIVRSKRMEIHKEGIVALSKSLLKGLAFLHGKGIVHGNLTSINCLIDTAWELRIGAWVETKLESPIKRDQNKVSSLHFEEDNPLLLWVAPELVKFGRKASQASDIYSLSMIFQELFTRKWPYHELSMSSKEIINGVLTCGIRPQFTEGTPTIFRTIMERSWDIDPAVRPRIETIHSAIIAAFPLDISFLDCVIRSVELYARELEEKIKGNVLT